MVLDGANLEIVASNLSISFPFYPIIRRSLLPEPAAISTGPDLIHIASIQRQADDVSGSP